MADATQPEQEAPAAGEDEEEGEIPVSDEELPPPAPPPPPPARCAAPPAASSGGGGARVTTRGVAPGGVTAHNEPTQTHGACSIDPFPNPASLALSPLDARAV